MRLSLKQSTFAFIAKCSFGVRLKNERTNFVCATRSIVQIQKRIACLLLCSFYPRKIFSTNKRFSIYERMDKKSDTWRKLFFTQKDFIRKNLNSSKQVIDVVDALAKNAVMRERLNVTRAKAANQCLSCGFALNKSQIRLPAGQCQCCLNPLVKCVTRLELMVDLKVF